MNILIMSSQSEFTDKQQKKLSALGTVTFLESGKGYSVDQFISLCRNVEILGFNPDEFGGFEVTPARLPKLLAAMPKIIGLALGTTAFGYVDLEYCRQRNISVTNVPAYSAESVAEHVLFFLLGLSKRGFLSDRQTQSGKYELTLGYELKGKTLGVIGLGSIGARVAELGSAIGMNVIAFNRTPKKQKGVKLVNIETLLRESDFISINLTESKETHHFLSAERINHLKPGVMIVNTADRSLVDEAAMAGALQSGHVDSYAFEAEDISSPPLGGVKGAYFFKGFAWYTKEALERNKEIWVDNIVGITQGKPINSVL